jgi:hypothetical protein
MLMHGMLDVVLPLYRRDWEHYASGGKRERVTRIEAGREFSISKTEALDGEVEFAISRRERPLREEALAIYTTATTGRSACSAAEFEHLRQSLLAFCTQLDGDEISVAPGSPELA